jgi:hypothetical protein
LKSAKEWWPTSLNMSSWIWMTRADDTAAVRALDEEERERLAGTAGLLNRVRVVLERETDGGARGRSDVGRPTIPGS